MKAWAIIFLAVIILMAAVDNADWLGVIGLTLIGIFAPFVAGGIVNKLEESERPSNNG